MDGHSTKRRRAVSRGVQPLVVSVRDFLRTLGQTWRRGVAFFEVYFGAQYRAAEKKPQDRRAGRHRRTNTL